MYVKLRSVMYNIFARTILLSNRVFNKAFNKAAPYCNIVDLFLFFLPFRKMLLRNVYIFSVYISRCDQIQ